MTNYVFQLIGSTIYYVENMGTIVDNIQEIKPDAFTTVPRLLEKVYDRIMFKGRNLSGISKKIFFWAVKTGNQYNETGNPLFYKIKLAIADKLVFSKWRKAFGDNIKFIVSGGAALQERLARIFYAARISVLEGYGLTETSPVLAVNNFEPNSIRFGTVGPPLKNVEIKIGEDGEILAKGDNIMMGYYKNPEITAEVIDTDGYFHTGDIGKFVDNRFLKITGRKKSIFKTSMGKYISPENIEDKLRESRFIEQAMIVGENQKFVAALIVPSFQVLKNWALMKGIGYMNDHEAIKNPKIKKRIQEEIDIHNKSLNSYEKIMRFELLPEEWTIETGEITPTLKVKRNYVCKKYEKVILKLFK
jgi:long-chain acyl-CoA synthetase